MESTVDLHRQLTDVLEENELEVLALPADTSTAEKAAKALRVTPKQIVKSLLVMSNRSPIMVLAAGDRSVNLNLTAELAGYLTLRMATAREVKEILGFSIGGVPPLGHKTKLPTILDSRLLEDPIVFAAAGTRFSVFGITPSRLASLTCAQILRVS